MKKKKTRLTESNTTLDGLTKRCSLTTSIDTNNHDNSWFPSEKNMLATCDGIQYANAQQCSLD